TLRALHGAARICLRESILPVTFLRGFRQTHLTADLLPGLLLAAGITAIAVLLAELQERTIGHAVLEPLVLALVLGLVVRALRTPPTTAEPGIAVAGKQLLEFAIVVLGLTLDLGEIVDAGA